MFGIPTYSRSSVSDGSTGGLLAGARLAHVDVPHMAAGVRRHIPTKKAKYSVRVVGFKRQFKMKVSVIY